MRQDTYVGTCDMCIRCLARWYYVYPKHIAQACRQLLQAYASKKPCVIGIPQAYNQKMCIITKNPAGATVYLLQVCTVASWLYIQGKNEAN